MRQVEREILEMKQAPRCEQWREESSEERTEEACWDQQRGEERGKDGEGRL